MAVEQLSRLHLQCLQQARQQTTFNLALQPARWLDWEAVQNTRCAAEEKLLSAKGRDAIFRLNLTRDVTLLYLLTISAPDRVGIVRTLRLSKTLVRTAGGGFLLDLSEPGLHKTSAIFGPSRTAIHSLVAHWLHKYISMLSVPEDGFLFYLGTDASIPLSESVWTRRVQACFKRHSASRTPVSPK